MPITTQGLPTATNSTAAGTVEFSNPATTATHVTEWLCHGEQLKTVNPNNPLIDLKPSSAFHVRAAFITPPTTGSTEYGMQPVPFNSFSPLVIQAPALCGINGLGRAILDRLHTAASNEGSGNLSQYDGELSMYYSVDTYANGKWLPQPILTNMEAIFAMKKEANKDAIAMSAFLGTSESDNQYKSNSTYVQPEAEHTTTLYNVTEAGDYAICSTDSNFEGTDRSNNALVMQKMDMLGQGNSDLETNFLRNSDGIYAGFAMMVFPTKAFANFLTRLVQPA